MENTSMDFWKVTAFLNKLNELSYLNPMGTIPYGSRLRKKCFLCYEKCFDIACGKEVLYKKE